MKTLPLVLTYLAATATAHALPGYGAPLTVSTGTVHHVSTLAGLKSAVDTANGEALPATILVADGTYVLDVPMLHITCPGLVVRGESGNRDAVVLRGPDEGPSASTAHIFLLSADHVTIADLTLGYCANHGIQIRGESPVDVSGTWIHNCRLVNCNEQFIKGSSSPGDPVGATHGIIENCLFEFTGGWSYQYYTGGIDIHKGVHWTVRDNLFRNIRTPNGQTGIAEHAIHFWNRCPTLPQNVVVERNWIINCDRGIGFGLSSYDGGHHGGTSVIRNNMIFNNGDGEHTDVGLGLEYASDVKIDNNTVVIPSYWAPIEYRFGGSSNLVFRNNLTDKIIRNRNNAPPAVLSNNVNEVQEAWFRDLPAGDLHLTPRASGAVNRGMSVSDFGDDMDLASRPELGTWDVGAHEYGQGWASSGGACVAPFDRGRSPTQELYVATTGSDTTGDGTTNRPYASVQHAASLAVPGTAVVVAPGVYPGGTYLSDLEGTPTAPIWIRGATPTNRPILNGATEGMHLTRVRYLVVEHLEVTGSTGNGVNCDDGGDYANTGATHHVVFRNLYIHDIGGTGNQDGLKLSGVNHYWVLDSEFTRCGGAGSGSGVDHVGCHHGVIASCYFHDLSGNAVQCKGGSSEIDILRSRIIHPGQRGINIGGSTGPVYFRPPLSTNTANVEARAIRVTANVFRGGVTPVAFVGCRDCVVANNTIIDPGDWHLRILQETTTSPPYTFLPCGDSAFINNLVYFDASLLKATDVNVGANTDPDSFLFANNLWYARNDAGASQPDLPVDEWNGIVGENPLLEDPPGENYAITLQSPAAASGLVSGLCHSDFSGAPYLDPPGIGAVEVTGDLDGDGLDDAWELRYFGDTNVTDGGVHEDADSDRFRDLSEFIAGTDPTNHQSYLALREIAAGSQVELRWRSAEGRTYTVYESTALPDLTELTGDLPATPRENHYTTPLVHDHASYSVGVRTLEAE